MREALTAGGKRPAHAPAGPGPTCRGPVPRSLASGGESTHLPNGNERVAQQPRNVDGRGALYERSAWQASRAVCSRTVRCRGREAMDKHAGCRVCRRCAGDRPEAAGMLRGRGLASVAGLAVAWVAVRRRRLEGQGAGVDAIAPAGGAGPVAEDMAQMTAAAAADHLGAAQQPALVGP